MSVLIEDIEIVCPYCGEVMEADVDCTGGNQSYYEDCQVCCAPVRLIITVDDYGDLSDVKARREDE
ncbi:MAG: CPXCG motif-containing cysteine-rich protein [Gammaproteobacteria bacterium]|nr:CPXCG motif-containing cysteine-rich protein [Gammaproteobacteria bacterium]